MPIDRTRFLKVSGTRIVDGDTPLLTVYSVVLEGVERSAALLSELNDMNAAHFNTRTRALNNTLYWSSQIIGATIFGYALDYDVRRTIRAKASFIALVVLTFAIWGGGYAWQVKQVTREVVDAEEPKYERLDWTDGGSYIGPMFLYIFYGMYDAAWQTCIYW